MTWVPVGHERPSQSFGTGIKIALRKLYCDPLDVVLDQADVRTLQALAYMSTENEFTRDVERLIEAIEKHDEIHVQEHFR